MMIYRSTQMILEVRGDMVLITGSEAPISLAAIPNGKSCLREDVSVAVLRLWLGIVIIHQSQAKNMNSDTVTNTD